MTLQRVFILCLGLFLSACTDSLGESFLKGGPLAFLKSFMELQVTFPTAESGKTITFKFHTRAGAIRPELRQALRFLEKNRSHLKTYKEDEYDCKQFAYKVFEDAQNENFEAKYVLISLEEQAVGHALAAIETSDAGTLYVDYTPYVSAGAQVPSRSLVRVNLGTQYLRMPLEERPSDFINSSYDFSEYQSKLQSLEVQLASYKLEFEELEVQKKSLSQRLSEFNAKYDRSLAATEMEAAESEQRSLNTEVEDLDLRFDALQQKEMRLRSSKLPLNWMEKGWQIKSIRSVP